MQVSPEDREVVPQHDPFDAPDAEDEADTRERVLEGGEDAGDGDTERVRREFEHEDERHSSEPDDVVAIARGYAE